MNGTQILLPRWVARGISPRQILTDQGVLVQKGRIKAIEEVAQLRLREPGASEISLPDCLLMPGFVNAHQHGKGLGEARFGYPDHFLEVWIHARAGRNPLNAYGSTLIACAHMIENGVTCAIHANTTFGNPDYEAELRASLRAYEESGIRVTVAVGAADRLALVYPDTEAPNFIQQLPPEVAAQIKSTRPFSYAGDGKATIALMERLQRDFAGHPRIRFCYGPAGPQWVSDGLFSQLANDAERKAVGLHLHCLESPSQAAVCQKFYPEGTLNHLARLGVLNSRTVLAHGVYLTEEDIQIAAESKVVLVRNPGSNLRLRNGIAPMAHYLGSGISVAIGTDNFTLAQDEDILKELRLAAALARSPEWSGPVPPSTSDLLDLLTIHGARAAQVDEEAGSIEVGMRADLVAVNLNRASWPSLQPSEDPLDALVHRADGSDVRFTMVEGEILYHNGSLTKINRDQLHQLALDLLREARNVPARDRQRLVSALHSTMAQFYEGKIADSNISVRGFVRGLGPS